MNAPQIIDTSVSLMAGSDMNSNFAGIHGGLCFAPTWIKRTRHGRPYLYSKDLQHNSGHVHRVTFKILLSSLEDCHALVLHRCGNASCHNPAHLYAGSDKENHRDKNLHESVPERFGPYGLNFQIGKNHVAMPQPMAMSSEPCLLQTKFKGFDPCECYLSDWLPPTEDGYCQLTNTPYSGEVVGAHRKLYHFFIANIDKYDIIRHACENKFCLNPYHFRRIGRHDRQEFEKRFDGRRRG